MGREARCKAVINGEEFKGTLLLESSELIFRVAQPRARTVIALSKELSVSAVGDELVVERPSFSARFNLGERLAKSWANRILNPPTLADKFGFKRVQTVAHSKQLPREVFAAIDASGIAVCSLTDCQADTMVIIGLETVAELDLLNNYVATLSTGNRLWVVYPRGDDDLKESVVRTFLRERGWVDIKVARVSDTHTSLQFKLR